MKMKKMLSALCALAMSVSAFAGLTVSAAEGDVTVNADISFPTVTTNTDYTANTTISGTVGNFIIDASNASCPLSSTTGYNGWLSVGKGSGTVTIPDNQLAGNTDKVTVSFKVAYGKLNNRYFTYNIADSNGVKIVDFGFNAYDSTLNPLTIGNSTDLPNSNEWYFAFNTPITARAAHYTYEFDFAKRTVTLTTVNMHTNAKTTHTNAIPNGVNNVKTLTIGSGYDNTDRRCVINDIKITTTEGPSAKFASYTVNYKCGDTIVKTEEPSAMVGDSVTISKASFFENNIKYNYVSDNSANVTVAEDGSTVVTVIIEEAVKYDIVVKAVGDVSKEFISENVYEGENYSYTFPRYIFENGSVYETSHKSDTYYGATTTNMSEDVVDELTYTKLSDNVVYFVDLDGDTSDSANVRASNGSAYGNRSFTSDIIEPGVYTIIVGYMNKGRGSTLTIGDSTIMNYADYANNNWSTATLNNITITNAAPIVLNAGGQRTRDYLDTIVVIKTGDITPDITTTVSDIAYTEGDDGSHSAYCTITVINNGSAISAIEYNVTSEGYNPVTATWQVPDGVTIGGDVKAGLIVNGLGADETVTVNASAK